MDSSVKKTIKLIKQCSELVQKELGSGWSENVYQKAMEVALRSNSLSYETQRILPITFMDHVVGENQPDFVIWVKEKDQRVGIIIDLKTEACIKEEHRIQVERYIRELRKQIKGNEEVYSSGLVINFYKDSGGKIDDGFERMLGIQILEVKG